MFKRTLAIGVVVILWLLALLQVYASLADSTLTPAWQAASMIPLLLVAAYGSGVLWAWLKHSD